MYMNHLNEYGAFSDTEPTLFAEIFSALNFLDWVVNDEQFDISSDNYLGFINLDIENFDNDTDLPEQFRNFVKHYNNQNIMKIVEYTGFSVEPGSDLEETIIHKIDS